MQKQTPQNYQKKIENFQRQAQQYVKTFDKIALNTKSYKKFIKNVEQQRTTFDKLAQLPEPPKQVQQESKNVKKYLHFSRCVVEAKNRKFFFGFAAEVT